MPISGTVLFEDNYVNARCLHNFKNKVIIAHKSLQTYNDLTDELKEPVVLIPGNEGGDAPKPWTIGTMLRSDEVFRVNDAVAPLEAVVDAQAHGL